MGSEYLILNHSLKRVFLVIDKRTILHGYSSFDLDLGRVTYAEMLYRTNLIAYVPADHITGLPSNVGTEKIVFCTLRLTRISL